MSDDRAVAESALNRATDVKKILNRVVPVVNEHHRDIADVKLENEKLRRQVAELTQTVQRLEATLGQILATHMGTGATSTRS